MKTTRIIAVVVLLAVSGVALHVAWAQQEGITRTDLQRHDLSVPGREVVQVRVDFPPGVVAPRHSHPGEEIVYAIEGLLEYQVEGKPPVTLKAGEVLFIPAGTIHAVRTSAAGTQRSSPNNFQRASFDKAPSSFAQSHPRGLSVREFQALSSEGPVWHSSPESTPSALATIKYGVSHDLR